MKYKITLNDDVSLIIDAEKEVDAVRRAKEIKSNMGFGKDSAGVHDSDELRQLAYKFAEMGSHFDRANSAHSREMLSKDDEAKYAEFFKLGLKVHEVLKNEVARIKTSKVKTSWKNSWGDTVKLLSDGADRMYWSGIPRLRELSKKIHELTKEYDRAISYGDSAPDLDDCGGAGEEITDAASQSQVQLLKSHAKSIEVFANCLNDLANGKTVRGYATTKDVVDEIRTFARNIEQLCNRINLN